MSETKLGDAHHQPFAGVPVGTGAQLRIRRALAAIHLQGRPFQGRFIFYNRLLRHFVLFNLKLGKLTHQTRANADVRPLLRLRSEAN